NAGGEGEGEALAAPARSAARRTEEVGIRLAPGACRGATRSAGLVVVPRRLDQAAARAVLDVAPLGDRSPFLAAGTAVRRRLAPGELGGRRSGFEGAAARG